jgi:DNA polymerase elongation subunit (family B)
MAEKRRKVVAIPSRPPIPAGYLDSGLEFFLVDIRQTYGVKWGDPPFIRMFGVTSSGNSVQLDVKGFFNYVLVEIPPEMRDVQLHVLKKVLDDSCTQQCEIWKTSPDEKLRKKRGPHIRSIEIVDAQSLMGYDPLQHIHKYFKIYMYNAQQTSDALEAQLKFGIPVLRLGTLQTAQVYDKIEYVQQYLVETGIRACSWIRVAGKCEYLDSTQVQLVGECNWKQITYDLDRIDVPPLRTLSFDIECRGGRKDERGRDVFVHPHHDPVITICGKLYEYGDPNPIFTVALQLGTTTDRFADAYLKTFEHECDLLSAFSDFVRRVDPDIMESYNGTQFDFPYLIQRAKILGSKATYGRDGSDGRVYESRGGTLKTADRKEWKVNIAGRINWDVIMVVRGDVSLRLRGYKLNTVARELLGDQKIDINHHEINRLQNGGAEDRARIVEYCIKDCDLPHRVSLKKMYFVRYIELARVSGTPIEWLIHKGQAIKASQQIRRMARNEGYIVPFQPVKKGTDKFEGATVIDPDRGYYQHCVSVCDFNSLYPNIMRAHNLSYETHVDPADIAGLDPATFHHSPAVESRQRGHTFINGDVKDGILPRLLTALLEARKKAKRDMAQTDDPVKKAVYNGRQLALKVSANAIYGFTGAPTAGMPMLQISEAVTSYGREMIAESKRLAEQNITIANGYTNDAKVIYGDSVTGDTPIVCKMRNGMIDVRTIESLFGNTSSGDRQYTPPPTDVVGVWSDMGFTEIKHVMRHRMRPDSELVRITTRSGTVTVTDDHSLLRPDGSVVKPTGLTHGMSLMHRDLPTIHCEMDPNISSGGVECQKYWLLLQSLGHTVHIESNYTGVPIISTDKTYVDAQCIDDIEVVGREEFVYDLETENHHFAAGVGRLIVHNTDSVMVHWGEGVDVPEAERLSGILCGLINHRFPPPCNIEFEKTFAPYLITGKKRYVGKRYEGGKVWISDSGLETARRDNCPLVPKVMKGIYDRMFNDGDWRKALEYAKDEQRKLMRGEVDITDLIITNELKNDPSTYKIMNQVAHLVSRMQKRDPSTAPKPGDRVPYVILQPTRKGAKKSELAEDPLHVVQHNLAIDYHMYNETQLAKPIYRLFQFFPGITESLFINGPHVQGKPPKRKTGNIGGVMGRFVVQYNTCLGCGRSLRGASSKQVCAACMPQKDVLVNEEKEKAAQTAKDCVDYWDVCLKCAGSENASNQCITRDCDRFYQRQIMKNKVKDIAGHLLKYDIDW